MYNKVLRSTKAIFSRCLKPFKKQQSHEVKEYGNSCCHLQRKTFLKGLSKNDISKKCRRLTIKPFVFLLCASGFFYQTWAFLQMYLAYPTTLDISEEYPDSFMAPAITICNRNRLFRQPYCKAYPELCSWKHTTWETFCDEYSRMCPETKPPDFNFGIPEEFLDPNRSLDYLAALMPQSEFDEIDACICFGDDGMEPCKFDVHTILIPKSGVPYKCFRYDLKKEGLHEGQLNLTLNDGLRFRSAIKPENGDPIGAPSVCL